MFELNLVVERYWQFLKCQVPQISTQHPHLPCCSAAAHGIDPKLNICDQELNRRIWLTLTGPWTMLEKLPKRMPFQAKDIFKGLGIILGPACILVGWVLCLASYTNVLFPVVCISSSPSLHTQQWKLTWPFHVQLSTTCGFKRSSLLS